MPFSAKYSPVLIIDIGNTNIVCAVFINGAVYRTHRFETSSTRSVAEYHELFKAAMDKYTDVKYVAIASVVPQVTGIIQKMFKQYSIAKVFEVNGLSALGLGYLIENPAVVGPDLVANAFAAWKMYEGSTIVIDLGTATTIQLISDSGLYAGVVICPGLKTAAANLFERAALLSEVKLKVPEELIGNNTQDALLSGIIRGHALMIKGFIEEIKAAYTQYSPYQVIITGGLCSVVKPLLPESYRLDEHLTLKGLYLALVSLAEQDQFTT
ncbi:MAG TPA: type III pantothenate kinase [Candidatus Cloacimonadota bacterium]|nr:type III pantothenate kinase [Candidatus Cloacimonadota bacterium]